MRGDGLDYLRVGLGHEAMEVVLPASRLWHRHVIQETIDHGVEDHHLLFQRHGHVLGLFEDFGDALTAFQLLACGPIQLRPKLGESGQFVVLRHVGFELARYLFHGPGLSRAANARDGDAHVQGRTDAGVEQVSLQVDLSVGDGDDVGGNVGGEVAQLGFDDGEGRQ